MTPSKKRVLIVDDDRDFVAAMQAYLEANGFGVMHAYTGRDGVRLARMERPDLILMDIMMDERTEGFFTIQEIRRREELKGIPIFVLSSLYAHMPGFTSPPDRVWMAQDEFLPKPVNMPRLLEKIHQRIGQPA
jgi:DNA-binding response OmpR family regulator